MLELIFQGFIEWTYGLILECWEYFSSMLLNVMSMDFAYLKERMPVIQPVMQTMLALGWAGRCLSGTWCFKRCAA